ncbi:hypothetical protein K0T92_06600 [Paenibacillus oenotherae]|uniref:Copper amine oxidase-like N-terminal domain-containing protein n=1 Tax=Paenibacillus oenotherae TaxID=1435645 RepID=A0ABS7D3A1_9BACL|nr:copper amine oxidase N-terminal domain-containing protein [Paenibacillus oenotherae]MBW7474409.1 hypothetical protein [Paenibacillus oenotherae]
MKMYRWGKQTFGLALLVIVLIVVAGCQAVGGLDFNAMLKQSLKVTSYEGTETIEFKLTPSTAWTDVAVEDDEPELLDLLTHFKLQLDHVKVADDNNMSMDGRLDFSGKSIGFSMKTDEKLLVIEIEGALKPFVFELEEPVEDELEEESSSDEALNEQNLVELSKQMMDIVGGYAIDNLPNPTTLTVVPAQESVGGETVTGLRVHAELNGKEIWTWMNTYLDALLSDKEGLREMLTSLFDLLNDQSELLDTIEAAESIFGSIPEEDMKADEIDEAVEEYVTMLTDYKAELEAMEKEEPEVLDQMFSKETYVKADLLVDSKLDMRKSVIEMSMSPQLPEDSELNEELTFESVWIKISSEKWNVNGEVSPEVPDAPEDALDTEDLFMLEGYQLLSNFSKGSDSYSLLRDDLHITRQTVVYDNAILTPAGITIVPLRETTEQLGGTLTKDAATGMLVVYDEATGRTISLKAGSKQAIVDGQKKTWAFPTTVVGGVTYVAARDLAKALGGQATWEFFEDDEMGLFVIERES